MSSIDTYQPGEGDEEKQYIQDWMLKNGFNLLQDTYNKLKEEGFETIDQLMRLKPNEIKQEAKEMGIKLADRLALRDARQKLVVSDKKNFVDPEEIKMIKSINLKIQTFENNVNNLSVKEKNINDEKEKIEYEINDKFNLLINSLNNRKQQLIDKLNDIVNKKNDVIKKRKNNFQKSLDEIKKSKQECDELIHQQILLDELDNRKLKIAQNEKRIVNVIQQCNQKHSAQINEKINFIFDTDKASKFVSSLGVISEANIPTLKALQYNNDNPDGVIKVFWKIIDMNYDVEVDYNNDDKKRKIQIEYTLINNNENKQDDDDKKNIEIDEKHWIAKDIEIDNKTNEGNESMNVDKVGIYLFKIKYFDKRLWSTYSNIESINITNIIPIKSNILTATETNILTATETIKLMQWMNEKVLKNANNKKIKYFLLYRMTRDGKEAQYFHQKCDNKGATLTVFHSNYNHVFGGYASVAWTKAGSYKRDDNSFIFLLRSQFGHNATLYANTRPGKAVYHGQSNGASFGDGVAVSMHISTNRDMYFYPEKGYKYKGNSLCGGQQYDATASSNGYHECLLNEYEVFQVVLEDI